MVDIGIVTISVNLLKGSNKWTSPKHTKDQIALVRVANVLKPNR